MPFVSSSIPNLINGVSQQAPEVRLPTQAEVQENGLSSVVNGLEKRPGTEHIKKLSGVTASNVTNAFIHTIQRDDSESYSLVIGKDGNNPFLYVYDRNGFSYPVKDKDNTNIIKILRGL